MPPFSLHICRCFAYIKGRANITIIQIWSNSSRWQVITFIVCIAFIGFMVAYIVRSHAIYKCHNAVLYSEIQLRACFFCQFHSISLPLHL